MALFASYRNGNGLSRTCTSTERGVQAGGGAEVQSRVHKLWKQRLDSEVTVSTCSTVWELQQQKPNPFNLTFGLNGSILALVV